MGLENEHPGNPFADIANRIADAAKEVVDKVNQNQEEAVANAQAESEVSDAKGGASEFWLEDVAADEVQSATDTLDTMKADLARQQALVSELELANSEVPATEQGTFADVLTLQYSESAMYGKLSRGYDVLNADGKANPYKSEDGVDPDYAMWENALMRDPMMAELEKRAEADGEQAQTALENAKGIAYATKLHPLEVVAASTGLSVGEYAGTVLGPYQLAEGPQAMLGRAIEGMADYHSMNVALYERIGENHIDEALSKTKEELGSMVDGIGCNMRDSEARAVNAQNLRRLANEFAELYGAASSMEGDAGKAFRTSSEIARDKYLDMSDNEHAEWVLLTNDEQELEAMSPVRAHNIDIDSTLYADEPVSKTELVNGLDVSGNVLHLVSVDQDDRSAVSSDAAAYLLAEHLSGENGGRPAITSVFGVFAEYPPVADEVRLAHAVSAGAKAHGLHPMEEAAAMSGVDVGYYVKTLANKQTESSEDARVMYAAAMQSLAEYHNMTPSQYKDHGQALVNRAHGAGVGSSLEDWSDEVQLADMVGTSRMAGMDSSGSVFDAMVGSVNGTIDPEQGAASVLADQEDALAEVSELDECVIDDVVDENVNESQQEDMER